MKITIKIKTGNAAFMDNLADETTRILAIIAGNLKSAAWGIEIGEQHPLYDYNGANVGVFAVDDESEATP